MLTVFLLRTYPFLQTTPFSPLLFESPVVHTGYTRLSFSPFQATLYSNHHLSIFYLTRRFMFPFDHSSDFTVHAPGDQAAHQSTPSFQTFLDLETRVMLHPASYLGAHSLIVLIFRHYTVLLGRLPVSTGLTWT